MFAPFSNDDDVGTFSDWASLSRQAMTRFENVLNSNLSVPIPSYDDVEFPSLEALVEQEITNRLNPADNTIECSLEEITAKRLASVSHWETQRLKTHWETSDDTRLRFQLPPLNAVEARAGFEKKDCVAIQVYKTINYRQTKLLEINFLLSETLKNAFDRITNLLPQLFDASLYKGSGLIVTPHAMYGDKCYAEPYQAWLAQTGLPQRPLASMDTVTLEKVGTVYQRKQHKQVRCGLCQSRPADLVVVNDTMLPKNPFHACSQCYRRLRSDGEGNFIDPPDTCIVSAFSQI